MTASGSTTMQSIQWWAGEHTVLDWCVFIPLAFVNLAVFTSWPLVACAAVSVALWLVLLPVVLWTRRSSTAYLNPRLGMGGRSFGLVLLAAAAIGAVVAVVGSVI